MKITKSALNKFIQWSTSRYNDYLGFGTKKENVEMVYKALHQGFRVVRKWSNEDEKMIDLQETTFKIECSSGNGEGQGYKYWRLKCRKGNYSYEIDCIAKTVKGLETGEILQFESSEQKEINV